MGDTNFDPVSDYRKSNPNSEQSNYGVGDPKEPSAGKGLGWLSFVYIVIIISIFFSGRHIWNSWPEEFQDYVLGKLPFIEQVKKPVDAYTVKKQTPGPDLTPPLSDDTKYQIHAIMNDGNQLRVDLKVHYKIKNDGGPIGKGHHENMVRMAVRKVINRYSSEQLYTIDRLNVESHIHDELQRKYFKDIIEVEIRSFALYFNPRTKAMFDARTKAKMAIEVAEQEVEIVKIHKKFVEAEMEVREYEQKRRLQLERDKKLYQAETLKLVDDILKKRKESIDAK